MVDRLTGADTGIKSHDPVAREAGKFCQGIRVSTAGAGGESNAVQPIEYQTTSSLKRHTGLLQPGEVNHPTHLKPAFQSKPFQNIGATLCTPVEAVEKPLFRVAAVGLRLLLPSSLIATAV